MQVCGVFLFKKQQFYDILVSRKSVVEGKMKMMIRKATAEDAKEVADSFSGAVF